MSDANETPPRHRIPVEVETEEVPPPSRFSPRPKVEILDDISCDPLQVWRDGYGWAAANSGQTYPRLRVAIGQWVIELPSDWSADNVRVFRVEVHE